MSRQDSTGRTGGRPAITRRDFVGGALIGSGAALLTAAAPGLLAQGPPRTGNLFKHGNTLSMPLTGLDESWTGPGGQGDYAVANGNTHREVNAAHALRNGEFGGHDPAAEDTGEYYDLVVVGAGFAGCTAAFRFLQARPEAKVLILDNHQMFGGEARQNEFEVDGYRLWGPQGSTGAVWPLDEARKIGMYADLWGELDLPTEFKWQPVSNSQLKVPMDNYTPMHLTWEGTDLGWHFDGQPMARNPWSNRFAELPLDDRTKQDLLWMEVYRQPPEREDWDRWLDSMTYKDFLKNEMGIDNPWVDEYLNPFGAAMGCGLGVDVISAYQAFNFLQPGVMQYGRQFGYGDPTDNIWLASFPGGNTGILRHLVQKLIPGIFGATKSISDVLHNPVDRDLLDRSGSACRMRLGSLVVHVAHEGPAASAETVAVSYVRDGRRYRLRAGSVVMAGQQHVNKRVVADLPQAHREAMDQFLHAPMMVVNVALRNWRFMDKLGVASVRWFGDDLGWFTTLRRQMLLDGEEPMPLDPDKPTVLTLYNSFCIPGLPAAEQTVAARMKMFGLRYVDIEQQIRRQFTSMFAAGGFDADRDIAGITVNRQGHAYVVTQPGFFFGRDGAPAPSDVVRQPHGRIAFAHAELLGAQMWEGAVQEGERAAAQVAAL
ncbi:NAD(P)-binding protein [Kineobactrum salinum]|uniref:NAD(P)-binding protein n=1 Tax=Kineobactrum salinum TaxID=2708301 RepID=A0A6C0U0S7_9GAMM|nr:NAD(P)-binding protein [Kineobactrum salinum]QIB64577.1 NAD(P)-binding protein [Kineobactrum salinum]